MISTEDIYILIVILASIYLTIEYWEPAEE